MNSSISGRSAAAGKRAFLSGAFGNVGEFVLQELLLLGYEVTCFDKPSPLTEKKAKKLAKKLSFKTVWGDLTDQASVMSALANARPTHIAHVAAIIPPLSVTNPELARKVNVEGTRHLVAAAELLGTVERIVDVSSYSVHGPCNPYTNPPKWTGDTPLKPQDDYAQQKAEAEKIVSASALPWCIVRLCAVFPLDTSGFHPDSSLFSFLLPYDRREQGIDVRDAALAIANALHLPGMSGRKFDVGGGGDEWQRLGGEFGELMMAAMGMPASPRDACRLADPEVDASWFYENWVDTSESQAALNYQRHSLEQYLADLSRQMGLVRFILPLVGKGVQQKLLKLSPYYGKPQVPDSRPFDVAARDLFNRTRSK